MTVDAVASNAMEVMASTTSTVSDTAWSADRRLGVLGLGFGVFGVVVDIVGVLVSVYAIKDLRRVRSQREKAVIAAHSVIERAYGTLTGLKPDVCTLGPNHEKAINDGLAAFNVRREELKHL